MHTVVSHLTPTGSTKELLDTMGKPKQVAVAKSQSLEDVYLPKAIAKLHLASSPPVSKRVLQTAGSKYTYALDAQQYDSSEKTNQLAEELHCIEPKARILFKQELCFEIEDSLDNHVEDLRRISLEKTRNAAHASLEDVSKAYHKHLEKVIQLSKAVDTKDTSDALLLTNSSAHGLQLPTCPRLDRYESMIDARFDAVIERRSSFNSMMDLSPTPSQDDIDLKQSLNHLKLKEAFGERDQTSSITRHS
ncbi:hypothetical protein BASA50_000888 [Batrachochytrium salamandrivorans]|uniref:Uncharacterized protein n=1 Tax=Batrachochytrium salamandrivorans TaxID=1357716 RepID=A0ABQ8ESS4_9FUNG|nr:hypothetical protein BASA62_006594 [Batrachochytrium salamandrivorans]KAH6576357.1 hypothetical protein BASA60_004557 [Batrachochytrium salamandrivorans]KAH6579797.1 hypothetical protein BASA61_010032 [Batrachochytrium salamandrivorans]KAH6585945.1 hypothetical protein BASA50_000888 [Batrachochytrium salamandrivorans]KAH6601791.1 hypothetical protein BASA61_001757 [Batrachochytrium salamandrivorans]